MDLKDNEKRINVEYYSDKNKNNYSTFLLNNFESNIFHTIQWKEIIESHYNFKSYYFISRDNNRNIRGILPSFYLKNMYGKRLDSIPLSIYGGALGEDKFVEPLVKKIFELNQELQCNYIIIKQYPIRFSHLFKKAGMKKIVNRYTQVVKLKKPDVLWREISKSNRNSIKKAIKYDVRIERIVDEEDLSRFHELELITHKRLGIGTPSLNFFKTIWKKLHLTGNVEVFVAKYKNNIIASSLIFPYNKKVIYGYANSENKHLNLRPNNLLLWKIIEWSYKKGYSLLDLGSTSYEWKGVFFFKSSFNTLNIPYAHYYFPINTTLIEDTALGKIEKIIIKKLPIFMTRKISSYLEKKFVKS
ncbi:hypothetical protein AYK24_07220 [Thermoplasmatales archaeon SG8-52-4]|nr:MAG: hypothetical protein AYK24_07220 [Thermoplasmatales archaeon SG8-52-4]